MSLFPARISFFKKHKKKNKKKNSKWSSLILTYNQGYYSIKYPCTGLNDWTKENSPMDQVIQALQDHPMNMETENNQRKQNE